jgi:hypothetical protein
VKFSRDNETCCFREFDKFVLSENAKRTIVLDDALSDAKFKYGIDKNYK